MKVLIIMHNCVNINYVFNQNKTSAISNLIEIIKFSLICFIKPKCIIYRFLAGINKKCIGTQTCRGGLYPTPGKTKEVGYIHVGVNPS